MTSRRIQRFWTEEELALARGWRKEGYTNIEIARRLNRTEHSVYFRLKGAHGLVSDQLPRRSVVCSPEQLAEARACRDAQEAREWDALRTGNLTALVCGDPPPGRSALDEKRRGA